MTTIVFMLEATKLHAVLGTAISRLRHDRRISQEELAFSTGLHRTSISLIERGCKSPTFDTIVSIALALSVKPSELIATAESLSLEQPVKEA